MSCITVCILKFLLDHEMKCYTASCHRSTFDSILGQDLDKLRIKGKVKSYHFCFMSFEIKYIIISHTQPDFKGNT